MSQDSNGILFLQRMKNKLKIAMTYHIHVRLVFRSYVHNNYMEKSYFRLKKMIVAVSNVPPVIKRICVQTKHKFHTEFWINIDYKHWKLRPNICTCNVCFRAWASAEIFPGGGAKSTFWLYFFRVVGDATQMDVYKKKMSIVTATVAYSVFLVRKLFTEQMF